MSTNRTISDYFQAKKRNENTVSASVGKIANNQPFNTNQNQITDRTNNYSNQANNITNNPFNAINSNNPFSTANSMMNNNQLKPNLTGNGTNNPFNGSNNSNDFGNKPAMNNSFPTFNNNTNVNQSSNNTAVGNNNNNGANNFSSNSNVNANNFNSYLNANVCTNQNYKIGGLAAPPANNTPINEFNIITNNSTATNSFNNPFTINQTNNMPNNNSANILSNANTNSFNTPPANSNPFNTNNNNYNLNNNNMLNNNNLNNNANNFINSNSNLNFNGNGNQINPIQTNNANPFSNTINNYNNNNIITNPNPNNLMNQIYSNNNNLNNNFNTNNNLNNGQNQLNSNLAQFSFNKNSNQNNNVLGNIPSNFNIPQQQEINTIDLKAYLNDFTKEDKEAYDLLNNFINRNGSVYSRVLSKTTIEEIKKPTTLLHMASYYWKSCEPALIRYIDYKLKQGKPINRKNLYIERKYQASKIQMNTGNNLIGFPNSGSNFNSNNNNNILIGNNGMNSNNNVLNSNNSFGNVNNTNPFGANNLGSFNNNNINNFTANQFQNNLNNGINSNNGLVNNNFNNVNSGITNNNPFNMNRNLISGGSNLNGTQGFNQMQFSNNLNTSLGNNNIISPLGNNGFNPSMVQNNNGFPVNNHQNTFGNNNLNNSFMNNNAGSNPQNLQTNNNNFFTNLIPNNQNLQNNNAPKDYDFFGADNTNANNSQINNHNINFNQGFNANNNNMPYPFNNNNTALGNSFNSGGGNPMNNQFPNINLNNNALNTNSINSGFNSHMQSNFNPLANAPNFNNNNNGFSNLNVNATHNLSPGFNAGSIPNFTNNNYQNSNTYLQSTNSFNPNIINQNLLNEEAFRQILLNQKLQELKKNPYGSLSNEADINKFLENFEKKDDEKLTENIKLKEKQRAEEQEKIKKDLYAKIDKILEEDAYENLFSGSKKSINEFVSSLNPNTSSAFNYSRSQLKNYKKKSIFENDKNLVNSKDYALRNKKAFNSNSNTTIINNNYNSYYNFSSNPFLYKNSNSYLLDTHNKLNNNLINPNSIYRPLALSSNKNHNLHSNINYNNISRRGITEKANLESMNKNYKNTTNKNFNINEFSSNYERLKQINLQSEIKANCADDFDFTNSIEYLKLTNDFLNLEEKKFREKTNYKYNASLYKNPFVVYKGDSPASGAADLSNLNRWKSNLNTNKKRELDAATTFYKRNKEALGPISEEKSETSEMISYEDIYLKKSENKDDCDVKKLKFLLKDPTIDLSAKFEISVNMKITGIELKKIVFDLLLKENRIFEGIGLSHENVLINTNAGLITNEKKLKSNSFINENNELLVLISNPKEEEKRFENPNKPYNPIYIRKNSEDSSVNNQKDNLELSSINTKGETHSNFEYSETKNILRDVLRLENPNAYNNFDPDDKENKNENDNEEKIENDLFNDYLIRKQLFKEAKSYFPKTMKYQTNPSLLELKNYSYLDLRKIENFAVFNQHGKITFKGCTDVTFLDLDKIIKMNPMEIIVYDDFDFPKVGEELNKPAVIELFNYHIPIDEEDISSFKMTIEIIEEHRNKVLETIKAKEGELIEFDLEKKILKFEVPYMRKSRD